MKEHELTPLMASKNIVIDLANTKIYHLRRHYEGTYNSEPITDQAVYNVHNVTQANSEYLKALCSTEFIIPDTHMSA